MKFVQKELISDMSSEAYHSKDLCSNSNLKLVSKGAAAYWHSKLDPIDSDSEALLLGQLVHALVLEPLTIPDLYLVLPEIDRRTKEGKAAYAELELDKRKKVKDATWQKAIGIADAITSIQLVQHILSNPVSQREASAFFTADGVDSKCRFDLINPEFGVILDIKTTSGGVNANDFAKTIASFCYDQQAAFYSDVAECFFDKKFKFIFIAVETSAPHDVNLYVADDLMIETGRKLYEKNIEIYKSVSATVLDSVKDLYSNRTFKQISLPAWALDIDRR